MKVLLTQDVPELGKEGEIKQVARGYARNYLIPKGLAVVATPGAIREAEERARAQAEREARLSSWAEEMAQRLGELTLTFEAKAGPTGRLYGSITSADVADALERQLGEEFDRHNIQGAPLRDVGEHAVTVQITRSVSAQVQVVVRAEGEEEPPPEEETPD